MQVIKQVIERDLEEKKTLEKQIRWIRNRQIATIVIGIFILIFMAFNLYKLNEQIELDRLVIEALMENLKAIYNEPDLYQK